ncbi:hypothetical protein QOZ80_9BG0711180 [Eleusine coracana subsp. coracana]|nr:hypothetical protein QOZ80_9BG0711180 [Eleusine coracana subsp. coracana]
MLAAPQSTVILAISISARVISFHITASVSNLLHLHRVILGYIKPAPTSPSRLTLNSFPLFRSTMARKKVTLAWIANDSTRRATFKKRRKGLMKKASELATLCDVDACVVAYGEGESQPEVWPSVAEAARVLARFKAMPELDQCKKMMDMEGFLKQRIDKLREQLHKAQREIRERETTLLLHDAILGRRPGLVGLTVEELASLGSMVESRMESVKKALQNLQGGQGLPPTALQLQLPQAAFDMSLPPLVPYAGPGIEHSRDVLAPNNPQAWMMDMPKPGGELGAMLFGSGFGGGPSTHHQGFGGGSFAGGHMTQLGNIMGAGFQWPDPSQSFHPM